jgi:hypothetical protein
MGKIKKDEDFSFPQKYAKIPGFQVIMEEFDALNEEDLKLNIIKSETSIEEQEQLMEADMNLKAAKELSNTLGSAYKEAKKYQYAKIKYALFCLDKMGKQADTGSSDNKE